MPVNILGNWSIGSAYRLQYTNIDFQPESTLKINAQKHSATASCNLLHSAFYITIKLLIHTLST